MKPCAFTRQDKLILSRCPSDLIIWLQIIKIINYYLLRNREQKGHLIEPGLIEEGGFGPFPPLPSLLQSLEQILMTKAQAGSLRCVQAQLSALALPPTPL